MNTNRPQRICPIPGCKRRRSAHHVMCARHWAGVPEDLQKRIWREYRREPGSNEHLAAVCLAISTASGKKKEAADGQPT